MIKIKKFLISFLCCFLCVFLSGCNSQQVQQHIQQEQQRIQQEQQRIQQEQQVQQKQKLDESVYIYTDSETGVQYICFCYHQGYAGMGGITPRLNSDGSLMLSND